MASKNLHSQYVNKRLSSARQLLLSADAHPSNAVYLEACIDSALLQTYYAIFHYVNELLESYQRPLIDSSVHGLSSVIEHESVHIPELREWRALLEKSNSYVYVVMNHPSFMLAIASKADDLSQGSKPASSGENASLIQVTSLEVDDEVLMLTEKNVKWVIDECCQLIQRQREHLIEC
jgi:uncharacterized protein (UPF0332 family)